MCLCGNFSIAYVKIDVKAHGLQGKDAPGVEQPLALLSNINEVAEAHAQPEFEMWDNLASRVPSA